MYYININFIRGRLRRCIYFSMKGIFNVKQMRTHDEPASWYNHIQYINYSIIVIGI